MYVAVCLLYAQTDLGASSTLVSHVAVRLAPLFDQGKMSRSYARAAWYL